MIVYAQPACTLYKLYHVAGEQIYGQAVSMARDVAAGLAFLHDDAKLVHGALSSHSIFIDERFVVKIGDVGCKGLYFDRGTLNTDEGEQHKELVFVFVCLLVCLFS